MDLRLVATVEDASRLRAQSARLCIASCTLIALSHEIRAQAEEICGRLLQSEARLDATRREAAVVRDRSGRGRASQGHGAF